MQILAARGANSIRLCTLLSKPERRKIQVDVDYLGFEIPDEFVVATVLTTRKSIAICRISAYLSRMFTAASNLGKRC